MSFCVEEAVQILKQAKRACAFTGAGVSVESGIPPFRGENGLWNKYNPVFIEIDHFLQNPESSWKLIKEIFYDFFGKASPNAAHFAIADMEKKGIIKSVITQNIDNLHQEAGSRVVHEFHGSAGKMICLSCHARFDASQINLEKLPPVCPECVTGLIKPDFIFFGEAIPEPARTNSFIEADKADVFLVIGTTGEVMPACMIPMIAAQRGAAVIEVNISPSAYTHGATTGFLQGPATKILSEINTML